MDEVASHYMSYMGKFEVGDRWDCPICGRITLVVNWEPLRKKVLIEGDTTVRHKLINSAPHNLKITFDSDMEEVP